MEKTRKFQIVYAGLTNLCQHIPQLTSREAYWWRNVNYLHCRRLDLSNILKLQAAFLYSIHHGEQVKLVFQMRGVDFTHFNYCCTFNQDNFLSAKRVKTVGLSIGAVSHLLESRKKTHPVTPPDCRYALCLKSPLKSLQSTSTHHNSKTIELLPYKPSIHQI